MHTASFIRAFSLLGRFLGQFPAGRDAGSAAGGSELEQLNRKFFDGFAAVLEREPVLNPWFTRENLMLALSGISSMLKEEVLTAWLERYEIKGIPPGREKTVGLVLAGNIPLVGFHDLLAVLASGHRALVRCSSRDDRLIRELVPILSSTDPGLGSRIRFAEDKLSGMDAVIATGSNNSARYFEYYFRNMPYIIRKNRNGVAVLNGNESRAELAALGRDIFSYFGMGCRNVTKLYIPEAYDLKILLAVLDSFQDLYQHYKYGNNVDYYRSIYLMNRISIMDNGVLLLKEDSAIASPVGVVFYERYSDIGWVQSELDRHQQDIQCIVSTSPEIKASIQPGSTQVPMPWDYADGVDTIRFLLELG